MINNIDEWLDKVYLIPPTRNNNMTSIWDTDDNKHENLYEFMWDKITDINICKNNIIYTLIDTEEGNYLIYGYHLVNRIGHFISKVNIEIPIEGIKY